MRRRFDICRFRASTIVLPLAVLVGGALCLTFVGCGASKENSTGDRQNGPTGHAAHDHDHKHNSGHDPHDSQPHDEHADDGGPLTAADVDMPQSYAEAVNRLQEYRQQILSAVAAGRPGKAHRPLDEMDIVIEQLMYIARDRGVARTDWEEVNLARRELRAQFDLVHAAIDAGERPDMSTAEQTTAAALARLQAVADKPAIPPETSASPQHNQAPRKETP